MFHVIYNNDWLSRNFSFTRLITFKKLRWITTTQGNNLNIEVNTIITA